MVTTKCYAIVYFSSEYGLQATTWSIETKGEYVFGYADLVQALLADGETEASVKEICKYRRYTVKEIKC